ncbi:hypothetical protein KIPB_016923, partial [Kipferlia bialata]
FLYGLEDNSIQGLLFRFNNMSNEIAQLEVTCSDSEKELLKTKSQFPRWIEFFSKHCVCVCVCVCG